MADGRRWEWNARFHCKSGSRGATASGPSHLVRVKSRFGAAWLVTDVEAVVGLDAGSRRTTGTCAGKLPESLGTKRSELSEETAD